MPFSPTAATDGPAHWSLVSAGTHLGQICNRSAGIAPALASIMGRIEISDRQRKKQNPFSILSWRLVKGGSSPEAEQQSPGMDTFIIFNNL
jgi:hypothetical protein